MKKNLLTFLFMVVLVCAGALVVSAKNTSSSANSALVSKDVLVAKTKVNSKELTKARALANSLKARCKVDIPCSGELTMLLLLNSAYESYCGSGGYQVSCAPFLADMLIAAGGAYEGCMNVYYSKNTDRTIDRKKTEKSRDVTSGE